jgi:hypothetical protein
MMDSVWAADEMAWWFQSAFENQMNMRLYCLVPKSWEEAGFAEVGVL